MESYQCEYCRENKITREQREAMRYNDQSSGTVTVTIKLNGESKTFQFPHWGLLHYIIEHGFKPPEEFIRYIMYGTVKSKRLRWYRGRGQIIWVGYLDGGAYERGGLPEGFIEKLEEVINKTEPAFYLCR